MQSDNNDVASPRAQSRRQAARQHRQGAPPHPHTDVFSDSGIPNSSTPKSKKNSRAHTNGERHGTAIMNGSAHSSAATHSQKGRPASAAAGNGSLATPSKPSYAGAAFHASPAPSSLPVPKFFSKSVPAAAVQPGFAAKAERDADKSDVSDGGNLTPVPMSGREPIKSPLDMFFNADKAERAKKSNSSELVRSSQQPQEQSTSKPREMFMLELDDTSSPAGSHRSTPSFQRQQSAPGNIPKTQSPDEQRRAAQTQSLKSFLNITAGTSNVSTGSPSQSPFTPLQGERGLPHGANLNTPSAPDDQYYGNRNLSPLFHAASRSPQPFQPPQHSTQQPHFSVNSPDSQDRNNYATGYNKHQYVASPSRSPAPYPPQHQPSPSHHGGLQQRYPPYNGFPAPTPSQPQPITRRDDSGGVTNEDVRSMENRMKKMLNMG